MVKLIEVFESKKQSYSSHSKLYFSYSKFMKTSVCCRFYTPVDCIESRIIRPKYDLHKIEHRSMFFRFAYHSFGTALEDSRNSSLRQYNKYEIPDVSSGITMFARGNRSVSIYSRYCTSVRSYATLSKGQSGGLKQRKRKSVNENGVEINLRCFNRSVRCRR